MVDGRGLASWSFYDPGLTWWWWQHWSKASAAVLLPRSPQSSVQLHGHGDPGTLLLRVRGLSEVADAEGREANVAKPRARPDRVDLVCVREGN